MIIGIDASRANKDHKSGTEWYSYYLIRCLAKLDKHNQYILYTDEPLKGGLLDLGTDQFYEAENTEEIPCPDRHGWQEIKSPGNNFRAKVLCWPFDFFWTQGRMSIEMLLHRVDLLFVPAHALPLIHPKRSVVTIHDIGFELDHRLYGKDQMGPESARGRKLLNFMVGVFTKGKYQANSWDYLRWSTEFAVKKAHSIITVSKHTKKDIIENFSAKAERITPVYNGYNSKLYREITDQNKINDLLIKYGIEQPYLLYVGRIEKKKNIPLLIEAFAIMRDNNKNLKHNLVLAGDASYGYDEVNYMIREFGLRAKVRMPGWVEEEDMPYLYNGADAFVFPSNYEGFGIPLLQAMASGLPIIASNVASIPEVVGEAALLFDPEYALSISKAMETILTDESLRKKLSAKGREQIAKFSWRKCAEETLAVLKKALADK